MMLGEKLPAIKIYEAADRITGCAEECVSPYKPRLLGRFTKLIIDPARSVIPPKFFCDAFSFKILIRP